MGEVKNMDTIDYEVRKYIVRTGETVLFALPLKP